MDSESLKKALIKATQSVRNKYRALRKDRYNEEIKLEKTYKPIVEPIKEFANKIIKTEPVKVEQCVPKEEPAVTQISPYRKKLTSTPRTPIFLNVEEIASAEPENDGSVQNESVTQLRDALANAPEEVEEFLSHYDPLPRRYLELMIRGTQDVIDTQYGVHYDVDTSTWRIGSTELQLDGADLLLGGREYKGTPGLYELIFKKCPRNYTDQDKQMYGEILDLTNSYRKNCNPKGQIIGNKGYKYLNIIKPLLWERTQSRKRIHSVGSNSTGRKGYGISKQITNKPIEYIYWNTPHELVERLRLLYASKIAGNTGNDNEIVSIIEELREEGIIE